MEFNQPINLPVNVSILAQYGVEIKKARTEEEYFNSDDEPDEPPAYQPKPGSPGPGNTLGTYVYLRDATKKTFAFKNFGFGAR